MADRKEIRPIKANEWHGFNTSLDANWVAPLTKDIDPAKGVTPVSTFDGVDDYVAVPLTGDLSISSAHSFVIFFTYTVGTDTANSLLTHAESGSDRNGVTILNSNKELRWGHFNGSVYIRSKSTDALTEGQEYCLIGTWDGSTNFNLYLDGVSQTGTNTPQLSGTNKTRIGIDSDSSTKEHKGDIFEVAIFDDELTSGEVSSIVAAGRGGTDFSALGNCIRWFDLSSGQLGNQGLPDLSATSDGATSFGKGVFTRSSTATVKDHNGVIQTVGIDVPRFEGARYINDSKGFRDNVGENAIEFDGVDDVIDCGIVSEINNLTEDFTITGNFKANDLTGVKRILGIAKDVTNNGWAFGTNGTEFRFTTFGVKDYNTGVASLETNKNYHFAVIYNSDFSVDFWLNGVFLTNITHTSGLIQSTDDIFQVGAGNVTGSSTLDALWDGVIDNVKIFSSVLSAQEIVEDYQNSKKTQNTVANDNLVFWYKLDDTDSSITDYSGNDNTGTFKSGGVATTPTNVEGVYNSDTKIATDTLKGVVIEQAETNLILRSEEFDNASWSKQNVTVVADNTTAPDGLDTADKVTSNSGGNDFVFQDPTISSGVEATYSVFVKNIDAVTSKLIARTSVTSGQTALTWSGSTLVSVDDDGDFEALGNGWYRVWITFTTGEANQRFRFLPDNTSSGAETYIWGAQVEDNEFPTSYIKTESSTVTRSQDLLSYDGREIATEEIGSIYVEPFMIGINNGAFPSIVSLALDTNNFIQILTRHTNLYYRFEIEDANVTQVLQNSNNNDILNFNSVGVTWKLNDSAGPFVNGVKEGEDTNCTIPDGLTELNIGRRTSGESIAYNGSIKNVKLWNSKRSNLDFERRTR